MSSDRELPPKSLKTQNELAHRRNLLTLALSTHCVNQQYGCYDPDHAKDLLRSHVCSFYDSLKAAYTYHGLSAWEWQVEIAEEAIKIVLGCWAHFKVLPLAKDFEKPLQRAIEQYLKRPLEWHTATPIQNSVSPAPPPPPLPPEIQEQMKSQYAASGVDIASGSPLLIMAAARGAHPESPRLSSQITSLSAARKMEAFMEDHALNQTEFAIKANTSDKTIRKFRQTGKVKRSILTGIASAMGITKDELLRP